MATRPTPKQVPWDREFWQNAAASVLSAQRCRNCGRLQFYPKPVCSNCLSEDLAFEPLSGRGSVYSFTVVRRPADPAFADEAPYVVLDVLLDEGIRMISRLMDESDADGLMLGDRLVAEFKPVGDGSKHLPFFRKVR
jgi:uncharacterized protein